MGRILTNNKLPYNICWASTKNEKERDNIDYGTSFTSVWMQPDEWALHFRTQIQRDNDKANCMDS